MANFIETARDVSVSPDRFFKKAKKEPVITSVVFFLSVFISKQVLFILSQSSILVAGGVGILQALALLLISVVAFPVILSIVFAFQFIAYKTAQLFGGRGTFENTLKAGLYSTAPSLFASLFLLLPGMAGKAIAGFAGAVAVVWSIYIYAEGLSKYHKLRPMKSLLVIGVSFAFSLALLLFVAFLILLTVHAAMLAASSGVF